MFQDDRHLKIFREFCYSSELTLFSMDEYGLK